VKNKCESSEKKDHWLYYADDKYDVSMANLYNISFMKYQCLV